MAAAVSDPAWPTGRADIVFRAVRLIDGTD